ncbi:conserved hypothetical protein [Pediculus humanus corporis]|uniref:Uncharacterized protein n=1 Tax=Pediculus humanus subsp. corporis TaxID=121224 RepID=E0VKI3_PEDHC|nr:uncharacterized protein Phum_PHUM264320 [Pediculus humanus corporis]EEB13889.1 conserved hypothetical protein [Pediculus humanus corporis]
MGSVEHVKNNSNILDIELEEVLTLDSCLTIISELIKFILYRKQQLPYTFDRLKYLITRKNSNTNQIAENGLDTLELLFEKTRSELENSKKEHIKEVALVFGSTPMMPKQVYIIHLPQLCLNHSANFHFEKKYTFHLLR